MTTCSAAVCAVGTSKPWEQSFDALAWLVGLGLEPNAVAHNAALRLAEWDRRWERSVCGLLAERCAGSWLGVIGLSAAVSACGSC